MEVHRRGQRAPENGVFTNGHGRFAAGDDDADGTDDELVSSATSKSKSRSRTQAQRFLAERAESDGWQRPTMILALSFFVCFVFIHWHFWWTPDPEVPLNDRKGMAQFSETIARGHIKHLSETIGFRQVGTKAHVEAVDLIRSELERIADDAKTIAAARGYEAPEMEVEVLYGTGSHRFDIAGKVVHKLYQKIPSVVARISCGPACDGPDRSQRWSRPAVLLNSHLDTNYGSQGAADAASGIAIMLEVARIMMHSPLKREMKNPVVLLFNGAEESLQDASHAFLFTAPHNKSARALINMEACGQGGREALFQVNSFGMAEAYKKGAKFYHGSSLANDVFGTGLVLSDTDYRQFIQYSDSVVGVDLAYYTNSYVYHTTKDIEGTMSTGSVRHFGDNVAGMTVYLATKANLDDPKFSRGTDFLHFDFLGNFILYTWSTAYPLYLLLIAASFGLVYAGFSRELAGAPRNARGDVYFAYFMALASVPLSLVFAAGAVAFVNIVFNILGVRPMVWFGRGYYPTLMFGPPILAGFAAGQWISRLVLAGRAETHAKSALVERRTSAALLSWLALLLLLATIAKIGSSFLVMFQAGGLLACYAVMHFTSGSGRNEASSRGMLAASPSFAGSSRPPIFSYVAMMLISGPLTMGYAISMSELFVPLLGRIGHSVPVDGIAAGLAVVVMSTTVFFYIPFLHRFGERHLRNTLVVLIVVAMFSTFLFSRFFPFDKWAPKRLYVQHRHNVTSGESFVDIAHADGEWVALDEAVATLEREGLGVVNAHTAGQRIREQLAQDQAAKYLEWESLYPFK